MKLIGPEPNERVYKTIGVVIMGVLKINLALQFWTTFLVFSVPCFFVTVLSHVTQ